MKLRTFKLTPSEINHLILLLNNNEREEWYFPPKNLWWEEHASLLDKLAFPPNPKEVIRPIR